MKHKPTSTDGLASSKDPKVAAVKGTREDLEAARKRDRPKKRPKGKPRKTRKKRTTNKVERDLRRGLRHLQAKKTEDLTPEEIAFLKRCAGSGGMFVPLADFETAKRLIARGLLEREPTSKSFIARCTIQGVEAVKKNEATQRVEEKKVAKRKQLVTNAITAIEVLNRAEDEARMSPLEQWILSGFRRGMTAASNERKVM